MNEYEMLQAIKNNKFAIEFITFNFRESEKSGQIKYFPLCELRLRKHDGQVDSIHYLYFTDLETRQPKTCFVKLITKIGLPPDFKMQKIKRYE